MERKGKRELILEAATEVFKEKGYHSATSEEIAKRAGVGKGTIYQYFASKQDIYNEIQISVLEAYGNQILASLNNEKTFAENIESLLDTHMIYAAWAMHYIRNELFAGTQHVGCSRPDKERMDDMGKRMVTAFTGLADTAIARKEIVAGLDTEAVLSFLVGTFVSVSHRVMDASRLITDEAQLTARKQQIKEESMRMILHGIGA